MADKVGVGIIGAGSIANNAHIPGYLAISDRCKIFAVADVVEEVAGKTAKDHKIPKAFSDYRRLLELDEIDAVSVCTPPAAHAEATIAALEAGKHVLCEKPMAMNASEAAKMVRSARKAGRNLAIGFQSRFSAEAQALKAFIDAGELGEVYFAKALYNRRRGIPSWGKFYSRKDNGGGPLIDVGVHVMDLALWLMGHPKPVSVFGATYRKFGNRDDAFNRWGKWNSRDFDVEDFAVALIKMAGGATLSLECSWALNIGDDEQIVRLAGDRGGADVYPFKVYKDTGTGLFDWTPKQLHEVKSTHGASVADFVDSVLAGRRPLVTGEHGLVVTRIVDAIYESSEKGELVVLK